MKHIPARELMSREVDAANEQMTLTELVRLFRSSGRRVLPVTDDAGRLTGVVSETDLFLKEKGVPFSIERVPTLLGRVVEKHEVDELEIGRKVTVGEVMTRAVATIDEDTELEDAAMLMLERKLSMLPVVSGDKLVGSVWRIDVLRVIYGP